MLRTLLVLLISFGLPLFGQDQKQQDAEKATADWLALVDAHDYAGSWERAAPYFKSAVTKEQWEGVGEAGSGSDRGERRQLKSIGIFC